MAKNTISTFAAFYGADKNVFFGNVGRSLEVDFLQRGYKEDDVNKEEEEEEAIQDVLRRKKLERLEHQLDRNYRFFEFRKQKLVTKFDIKINVLCCETKGKDALNAELLKMSQEFEKERSDLQHLFIEQRNNIIRNHNIQIYGYYDDSLLTSMNL